MADTVKRYIKPAMTVLIILMYTVGLGGLPASARPVQNQDAVAKKLYNGIRGDSAPLSQDMIKILAALETRVGDRQRLLEKTEEKLARLSEKDLRLIASLCERIPADGHSAESDIAFLLATALVILS